MPQKVEGITGVISPSETRLKLSRTYHFLRKLGEGGMGEVFLAKTFIFGKDKLVAIKVLNKNKLPAVDALERFYREAENLDKAKHPNIVGFVEFWENEHFAYLVMEYVPGIDLEAYVEANAAFPKETAMFIMIQILKALAYMFEKHAMSHRDIKPSNIQLVEGISEEAVLMDFGNAKIISDAHEETSLTMVSMQMSGTPGYMALEVGMDNFEQEDDVFAIAVTLLYCLFGKNPFLVDGDFNASRRKIFEHDLDLEKYEGTMLGHWLHINTDPMRKNRMTLVQAYRSLEKILKSKDDFFKPVAEELVRFLGSDQALMEFVHQGGIQVSGKGQNHEDIAMNRTLPITDLANLGMTNPRIRLADIQKPAKINESLKAVENPDLKKQQEQQLLLINKGVELDKKRRIDRKKRFIIVAVIFLIILALLAGIAYKFFFNQKETKKSELKEERPSQVLSKSKTAIVESMAAMKKVTAKIKKIELPNIKNLKKFNSIRKIYKFVRNSKKRVIVLKEANLFYQYAEMQKDKKASIQAEWRWLSIYRKANIDNIAKAKVVKSLFNLYCDFQKKKKVANIWGRRHGRLVKEKLICH